MYEILGLGLGLVFGLVLGLVLELCVGLGLVLGFVLVLGLGLGLGLGLEKKKMYEFHEMVLCEMHMCLSEMIRWCWIYVKV